MSSLPPSPLDGVEVLLFDVFGTVVDWRTGIVAALSNKARGTPYEDDDWNAFAYEWRSGYQRVTARIATEDTVQNPITVDVMHKQLLDEMLDSTRWNKLAKHWNNATRDELVLAWHHLDGWEDTVPGLQALKSKVIIGTLSNGNIRLLVDMAKHAGLPWDVVLSSELFKSYKPNPTVYNSGVRVLGLPPHKVALVAAHVHDCAAAKRCGMKAVYIRRFSEDRSEVDKNEARVVREGFADVVVNDLGALARLVENSKRATKSKL